VEIDLTQLQYWYRTLDHLLLNKDKIEATLYQRQIQPLRHNDLHRDLLNMG
jgi:hypothetical protein